MNIYFPQLFQWAPTLGGECYLRLTRSIKQRTGTSFNGHPPLGVNATCQCLRFPDAGAALFQWAPTLGGECYFEYEGEYDPRACIPFQWAPTLGGECYQSFF